MIKLFPEITLFVVNNLFLRSFVLKGCTFYNKNFTNHKIQEIKNVERSDKLFDQAE